jgi:hypothetical protein
MPCLYEVRSKKPLIAAVSRVHRNIPSYGNNTVCYWLRNAYNGQSKRFIFPDGGWVVKKDQAGRPDLISPKPFNFRYQFFFKLKAREMLKPK